MLRNMIVIRRINFWLYIMLESNCEFAKQMKEQQKLSEEEYNMVLELYKINEEAEEKG